MQRIVVFLEDDAELDTVAEALTEAGAVDVDLDAIRRIGALRADFPPPDDVGELIARVEAVPGVSLAEAVGLRGPTGGDPSA